MDDAEFFRLDFETMYDDNEGNTQVSTPAQILKRRQEALLARCVKELEAYDGTRVRVYLRRETAVVTDAVVAELRKHWSVDGPRKVWELPLRRLVIDITAKPETRPARRQRTLSCCSGCGIVGSGPGTGPSPRE